MNASFKNELCTRTFFLHSVNPSLGHVTGDAEYGVKMKLLQHSETSGNTNGSNGNLLGPGHDASSTGEVGSRWRGGGKGTVGSNSWCAGDSSRSLDLAVGDLRDTGNGSRGLDLAVGDLGDSLGGGLDLTVSDLGDTDGLHLSVGNLGLSEDAGGKSQDGE